MTFEKFTIRSFATPCLLAAVMGLSSQAQALTPTETVVYSSVFPTSDGVFGTAFAHDGVFPALGQQYQTQTAWWRGLTASIVFEFDREYAVTDYAISLDNNDNYRIEFSLDGSAWNTAFDVLAREGSVGFGMDTFSGLFDAPITARYARVTAFGGDSLNSVGELQLTAAVPEPETYALMLAGLGLLGAVARRRNRTA